MFAKNITVEGAEEFIKKAINEQQFPVEPVKGDLARIPIGTYPNTQGTPLCMHSINVQGLKE